MHGSFCHKFGVIARRKSFGVSLFCFKKKSALLLWLKFINHKMLLLFFFFCNFTLFSTKLSSTVISLTARFVLPDSLLFDAGTLDGQALNALPCFRDVRRGERAMCMVFGFL